jgi:hypothetical protein
MIVFPELELVVVATSSLTSSERGSSRRVRHFVDRWIVPAFGG